MYEYLYEFIDRKIHFRGGRPYVGTRFIASTGEHRGFHSIYLPCGRDESRPYVRQSHCDFNTICFWRKIVVSLQQQTGRTAMVRPVFVEKSPFHRVFCLGKGKITWLVVFLGCHVEKNGSHVRRIFSFQRKNTAGFRAAKCVRRLKMLRSGGVGCGFRRMRRGCVQSHHGA